MAIKSGIIRWEVLVFVPPKSDNLKTAWRPVPADWKAPRVWIFQNENVAFQMPNRCSKGPGWGARLEGTQYGTAHARDGCIWFWLRMNPVPARHGGIGTVRYGTSRPATLVGPNSLTWEEGMSMRAWGKANPDTVTSPHWQHVCSVYPPYSLRSTVLFVLTHSIQHL